MTIIGLRVKGQGLRAAAILLFVYSFIRLFVYSPAYAQTTDCSGNSDCVVIKQQIDELIHLRELNAAATTPLEVQLKNLDVKIVSAQKGIDAAVTENKRLAKELDSKQTDMAVQYQLLSVRVRNLYKRQQSMSPFLLLVGSSSVADLTRELGYRQAAAVQDREIIIRISEESKGLEAEQKKQLERKNQLAALQVQLDKEAAFFRKEIKGAKEYQAQLSGKIAELSAKQKAILSEKAETFQTTVGDVPLADDPASRPDYNPGFSPAFAAFSFGAPHFKGMSQYGAFGRAKQNQGYEQILKAYYGGGIEIKDHNPDAQIRVDGYGTYSLEEYAKRIYEMPGSWGDEGGMEALKAQAVAARSYALARGGSICATEACQVFKPGPKGGNWERAVNDTRGKVIYANGSPFSAWYASTSGGYQESYSSNGYSTPGFWDTKNGRSGWTGDAYEKIAASPWFYKGWYKSRSGDNCGREHPWLNSEEMADILNAWAVLVKSGQKDDRVMPMGGCWGGNPYSIDELRSRSESLGGGFKQVKGVSVTYSDIGVTSSVTFDTDKGSVAIAGSEFKKAFNLRAPGRIALKSGLFNVERK